MDERKWKVSSYSGGNNNCVEVAIGKDEVSVRDTKDRAGGELRLGPQEWHALLYKVKAKR
jgi:hypothetical protein